MNRSSSERVNVCVAGSGGRKKTYETPELVEWGKILELTHGLKSGFQDFPLKGGTTGV